MEELSYQTPEVKETETFYRRAKWWITHKEGLRRGGLGVWMVIDALLILFAVWVFIDTFLIHYETERGLLRALLIENQTALHATTASQAAQPVRIEGAPVVLSSSGGAFDLVGFVTNVNEVWWADVTYQFTYGTDSVTPPMTSFVYPGESRAVVALGVEGSRPANVKLRVLDLHWHRIDPHLISDFSFWKAERLTMPVTDASFTTLSASDSGVLGRSVFSITNQTAYGYWSVPLTVLLKHGSAIVGVNTTVLDAFEAGETRQVELSWFESFPSIDAIEVVPTLNVFDASVYMPLRADRTIDTRTNFGF